MALNYNSLISDSSLNNQNGNREDKNDTSDNDILIKELLIDNCDQWAKSGSETYKCLFSQDEKFFAWSSGFQMVTLVPKHVYLDKNASNDGLLTINCGDLVRSLLFIDIKNAQFHQFNFWPKSSKSSLFLCTGLKNGKIRIYDTIEGKLLLQLNDHKSIVTDLATNSDENNLLISCSFDSTIKIRDLFKEGDLLKTIQIDGQQIETVQVSPNNQYLAAAGSSNIVYIYDMNNYELINKLIGHRHRISSISFSPDSKRLASASFDSTCYLWNLVNGTKIAQFNHLDPEPSSIFASGDNGYFCRSICFSPDNHFLLTCCDDNCDSKVRIWDLEIPKFPIKTLKILNAISCKYSPTGINFAVGTKNGSVFIYKTFKSIKNLLSLCRTEILKKDNFHYTEHTLPKELCLYLSYEDN